MFEANPCLFSIVSSHYDIRFLTFKDFTTTKTCFLEFIIASKQSSLFQTFAKNSKFYFFKMTIRAKCLFACSIKKEITESGEVNYVPLAFKRFQLILFRQIKTSKVLDFIFSF